MARSGNPEDTTKQANKNLIWGIEGIPGITETTSFSTSTDSDKPEIINLAF